MNFAQSRAVLIPPINPLVVAEEEDKDADKETNRIELRTLGELAGGSVLAE